MAHAHPHMVILGGPDGGREITLDRLPARIGRASQCEITLAEQYVSREHLLLSATPEGVVVEILSPAGIRIDGKKYKKGKAVILATGDVLTVGAETDILFIDAGDDAQAALAEVQADRQAQAEARRAKATKPTPAPPAAADKAEAAPEPSADKAAPAAQIDEATLARRKRTRKIVIALGIYLALLAAGGIALSMRRNNRDASTKAGPPVLSYEQIAQALEAVPDLEPNSTEAAVALAEARQRFASRHVNRGDAYRCVKQYLRYRALSGHLGLHGVDQRNYQVALNEDLLDEANILYQNAILASRQARWHAALENFEKLQTLIPLQSDPIHHNVQRHLAYVKARMAQSKKKRRKGPLG